MASQDDTPNHTVAKVLWFVRHILAPERSFYVLGLIYGLGISLLSLATPVSVQMLINTVAYTGLTTPLIVLALGLFILLAIASALNAMRIHLMDLFSRHFYSRMISEIALRTLFAKTPYFDDEGRDTLFNRYFDIIIVLKSVPNLIIGGFTILLQMVAGFVLVSLYHPVFMVFSLVVVLVIWLLWALSSSRTISSAVELSHRKHATAAWLELLGSSNGAFTTERHREYAIEQTEKVTQDYISQHRLHFRNYFLQIILLLAVYVIASSLLLAIGGWLVIQGELTLGQLVAAELVLSAAFYGVSQLGIYLTYFYDLCGAIDELSMFYDVEQEDFISQAEELPLGADLVFERARGSARNYSVELDFRIEAGARVCAVSPRVAVQHMINALLKKEYTLEGGLVKLGGVDLGAIAIQQLAHEVIVLDRSSIFESTIRDYLAFGQKHPDPKEVITAAEIVGLSPSLQELPQGLDTPLSSTGWPLSVLETLQLKLAAAILAQPQVLVLSQLYDTLPPAMLRRALDYLQRDGRKATFIYYSNRQPDLFFDQYLLIEEDIQSSFANIADFQEALAPYLKDGSITSPSRRMARAPLVTN